MKGLFVKLGPGQVDPVKIFEISLQAKNKALFFRRVFLYL